MNAATLLVIGSALLRSAIAAGLLAALSAIGFSCLPAGWRVPRARIAIPLSLSAGSIVAGCGGWIIGTLAGTAWILPFLAIALVVAAFRSGRTWLRAMRRVARELGTLFRREKLSALMLLLPLAFAIPRLLAPLFDADGIRYHVALPKLYLLTGRIFFYPWDVTGGFPQLAETIFLAGYRIAGGEEAKFLHFGFFLATIAVTILLVHEGKRTRRVAILAAFLFACTPLVLLPSSAAFIDLVAMFHLSVAMLVIMRSRRIASSGIGMAAAFATKMTTAPGLAGLAILAIARTSRANRLRTLAAIAIVPVIAFAPFAIRNLIHTGDPFFPLGYGILHLPIPSVDASSLQYATYFHSQIPGVLGIPWYPQRGAQLDEVAGLHHLLGLFALLLVISRRRLRPLLALIFPYIVLGLIYRPPARYSIPMFFALAILESHALVLLTRRFAPLLALLAGTIAVLLPVGLPVASEPVGAYLAGRIDRQTFLASIPGYRAALVVNRQTAPGKVMALDFPAPYYFDRPWIAEGVLNEPPLEQWVRQGDTAERLVSRLDGLGVRYLVVTPGYGGGTPYSLLPLAATRQEALQVIAFRQRLRPVAQVDSVDIYEVP